MKTTKFPKDKNYSQWLDGHVKFAKKILPNLPQYFQVKNKRFFLVFDRGPRGHIIAYYPKQTDVPIHEGKDENLYEAGVRMLKWVNSHAPTDAVILKRKIV